MKKLKKLIVTLILCLFAFIPLLFVKEDVKADSFTDYEVVEVLDFTVYPNSSYYAFEFDYNMADLIDINNFNCYGLMISYTCTSNLSNSSFDFSCYSYFSYYNDGYLGYFYYTKYFNLSDEITTVNPTYRFNTNSNYFRLSFSNIYISSNTLSNISFTVIKYPSIIYSESDLEQAFDDGYNIGYEQAKEDVILKDSPLLNGQLMIYDYENTLLESEPIDSIYLNNDGTFKYGLIYERVSSALNDTDTVRVDIIFSYPITPNDMLQEYLRNSTSLNINSTLSSLSWIASNGYYVDRDISNIDSNYELFDFNLVPNVQGVSLTARVSDLVNFSYGIVESASDRYYNDGYQKGYYDGTLKTEELVNNAFDEGITDGFNTGYNTGYSIGYSDGMLVDYSFSEDLIGIAEIPFNTILQILNFEILGINVFGTITGILTLVLAIWLFRKFRG